MFNKDKPGEFNPKHRIVGAIILVSAAVIILPMILSEREAPGIDPVAVPTPSPSTTTKTVVAPIPRVSLPPAIPTADPAAPGQTDPKPAPVGATPPAVVSAAPANAAQSQAAGNLPVVQPRSAAERAKTVEKQAPVQATKPETLAKLTGWYVQVGTFSQAGNARQLAEKLKKKGYSVQLESATVNKAKVVRVRVGPYDKNVQARNAIGDINKAVGIKGVVGQY